MALSFNSEGNLYQNIALSYEQFIQHFGTNSDRLEKIESARQFFKIFYSCGCDTVFIGGSFVSKKRNPEDIDLCFDITKVDKDKLKKEFPQFFDPNSLGTIPEENKCHIFYFTTNETIYFDMLSEDRDGNPKGLVKLDLKEIVNHDQKRKTI